MEDNEAPEMVEGLYGINKEYIGSYTNHYHFCEINVLGNLYKKDKKEIEKYCPKGVKYREMNQIPDECAYCKHSRRFDLTDDGNHIIGVT